MKAPPVLPKAPPAPLRGGPSMAHAAPPAPKGPPALPSRKAPPAIVPSPSPIASAPTSAPPATVKGTSLEAVMGALEKLASTVKEQGVLLAKAKTRAEPEPRALADVLYPSDWTFGGSVKGEDWRLAYTRDYCAADGGPHPLTLYPITTDGKAAKGQDNDARLFFRNPLEGLPPIRFYAGFPRDDDPGQFTGMGKDAASQPPSGAKLRATGHIACYYGLNEAGTHLVGRTQCVYLSRVEFEDLCIEASPVETAPPVNVAPPAPPVKAPHNGDALAKARAVKAHNQEIARIKALPGYRDQDGFYWAEGMPDWAPLPEHP